jgi:surface polysaccharide O-acyltransferase-like enzyme
MQNIETHTNKKELSFEIMRSIACFFIVAIHVFGPYFSLFGKLSNHSWLFADAVMSLSRFSVPLFVMISGALLLGKDISISKALRTAGKLLLILIIWSAAYLLICNSYLYNQTYSLQQIISMFLNNEIRDHFWYLYMLIGIYITLPFIRVLTRNSDLKLQTFYIIIFLSYSFIRMVPRLLSTLLNWKVNFYLVVPFMDWQIGSLFLGYFINNLKITKKKFLLSIIVFFTSIVFTINLAYIASLRSNRPIQSYFDNSGFNTIFATISIFIIIKYISKNISKNNLLERLFRFIGSISFEIYLVHPMVKSFYLKVEQIYPIRFIPKLSLRYVFQLVFVFSLSVILACLIKFIIQHAKKIIIILWNKSFITA